MVEAAVTADNTCDTKPLRVGLDIGSTTVKAVAVNGVTPSEDTVKDGSYEIQRPFVMVTKEGTQLSEAAQAFLDFAMSADAAEIIAVAGAVSANA